MSNNILLLFWAILMAVFIVAMQYWQRERSGSLLAQWAARNGYQVIQSERRVMRRGPFFWTTSRGQVVFYVIIRDVHGFQRAGWVRCGGHWLGLWSDQVDVLWERIDQGGAQRLWV